MPALLKMTSSLPKTSTARCDRGLDVGVHRHVGLRGGGGALEAERVDLGDGLLGLRQVDVDDEHLRALADELLDGRPTDSARAAGDEGDFAFQTHVFDFL